MQSRMKSVGVLLAGIMAAFGLAAYEDNKTEVKESDHTHWLQSKGCNPTVVTSHDSAVPGIPYCPDHQ